MSKHEQAPIRVSTIIPVYNGAATVARAIDSALAQEFDGQEIIVVNDGSTDNTAEVLAGYGDRIRVIHQANGGAAKARDRAASRSNAEFLAFLDCDDFWTTQKLARAMDALGQTPQSSLAYSDYFALPPEGGPPQLTKCGGPPSLEDLFKGPSILTSTIVIRRSIFEQCGGFSSLLNVPRCGFEDLAFWLVAREHGQFAYVSEPLMFYQQSLCADLAEKYEVGRKPFIRLIRERYGAAAETMVAWVNRNAAQSLLQKALLRLDARDLRSALRYAWWSFRIRPALVFELGLVKQIFRVRTLRRVLGQAPKKNCGAMLA